MFAPRPTGHQNQVAINGSRLSFFFKRDSVAILRRFYARCSCSYFEIDTFFSSKLVRRRLAIVLIKEGENLFAELDNCNFTTESIEDGGKL